MSSRNQINQFAVVDFAGAEQRQFFEIFQFAGRGEVGQAPVAQGGPHRIQLDARLVGDRDQHLALVFIRPADHRDLETGAELRKRSRQGFFDRGQADHFAADFGEAA